MALRCHWTNQPISTSRSPDATTITNSFPWAPTSPSLPPHCQRRRIAIHPPALLTMANGTASLKLPPISTIKRLTLISIQCLLHPLGSAYNVVAKRINQHVSDSSARESKRISCTFCLARHGRLLWKKFGVLPVMMVVKWDRGEYVGVVDG